MATAAPNIVASIPGPCEKLGGAPRDPGLLNERCTQPNRYNSVLTNKPELTVDLSLTMNARREVTTGMFVWWYVRKDLTIRSLRSACPGDTPVILSRVSTTHCGSEPMSK